MGGEDDQITRSERELVGGQDGEEGEGHDHWPTIKGRVAPPQRLAWR